MSKSSWWGKMMVERPSDKGEGLPGFDPKKWDGEDSWLDPPNCPLCDRSPDFCECPGDGDEPPEHESIPDTRDEHSLWL